MICRKVWEIESNPRLTWGLCMPLDAIHVYRWMIIILDYLTKIMRSSFLCGVVPKWRKVSWVMVVDTRSVPRAPNSKHVSFLVSQNPATFSNLWELLVDSSVFLRAPWKERRNHETFPREFEILRWRNQMWICWTTIYTNIYYVVYVIFDCLSCGNPRRSSISGEDWSWSGDMIFAWIWSG